MKRPYKKTQNCLFFIEDVFGKKIFFFLLLLLSPMKEFEYVIKSSLTSSLKYKVLVFLKAKDLRGKIVNFRYRTIDMFNIIRGDPK